MGSQTVGFLKVSYDWFRALSHSCAPITSTGTSVRPRFPLSSPSRHNRTFIYRFTSLVHHKPRYNITSIYLATDDADVVADTLLYPQFTWHFLPGSSMDRSKATREVNMDKLLRRRDFDHFTEVR